jgi:hypothetical protein
MRVSEKDLVFLRIYSKNSLHYDFLPEDKKWMEIYLGEKESRILVFLCLLQPFYSDYKNQKYELLTCFRDFTGETTYATFFYKAIDKIEYLDRIMKSAKLNCDFEVLSDLHSAKIRLFSEQKLFAFDKRIDYCDALEKYPEQVSRIKEKIQVSTGKHRNCSLEECSWFISNKNPNSINLICKKGTHYAWSEKVKCQ